MKRTPSDGQGRQGIAIVNLIVERIGHQFREQPTNDVGIDAHVELVNGEKPTGQLVALQIKGGPSFLEEKKDDHYVFRGDLPHLDYWLSHSLPVFIVLVDTTSQKAYWQEISEIMVERLDKGWKIAVPFSHDLATNFVPAARERVGIDAHSFSYTRLALQDTSNANAKRYSAKLLMRHPVTRLRAEAVIRRATADIQKERYNLDGFKQLFGDRDADVVSLYVAGDLHDAENANWYCRTLWVSKDLAPAFRPQKLGGEDLGNCLEVVWNKDYASSSGFYHGLQTDKQSFLAAVKRFSADTKETVSNAFGEGTQIVCAPDSLKQLGAAMRALFLRSSNIGLPPYECKDVADRFGDVMAVADNAFIYADKLLAEPSNHGWPYLLENTLREYRQNLDRLGYEIEKTR